MPPTRSLATMIRLRRNSMAARALSSMPPRCLWRLLLRGTGSQRRWREVTGHWLRRRTVGNRAFDLVHAVMALAASKQHERARQVARQLKGDTMLRARSGTAELALAEPLIAAIMSFCCGDCDGVVESNFGHPGRGRSMWRQRGPVRSDSSHAAGGSVARATQGSCPNACGRLNRWLEARAWTVGSTELAT
jgi:hypothetical protein